METLTGTLNADNDAQIWSYNPGETSSTVLVQTIEGTLDPALELLNGNGDIIASSNDFAPDFSTAARLAVPAGEGYYLRVSLVFGEGSYQITALPGNMHLQWHDDFETPLPDWAIFGAKTTEGGVLLETPLVSTRLFTPLNAPRLSDLYLQARLSWAISRPESEAGLVVRGNLQASGQISGWRLMFKPDNTWSLQSNDGLGNEEILHSGTLPAAESLTLGLLAEGERVAFFANGMLLGEVRDVRFNRDDEWGVLVYDGQIKLEDFQLATFAQTAPSYPAHLASWDSSDPDAIAAELIEQDLIPPNGQRQYMVMGAEYSINGISQRNFLLTDEDVLFGDLVLGADVVIQQGEDVGCGVLVRWGNRENKVLAFVDNQGGAGLLLWEYNQLQVNNYTMLTAADPSRNRLLLVAQDQFLSLYVNGDLTAQALAPRRMGKIGVGFINYTESAAACGFYEVWVWE
jgi:hypothetical protein